MSDLLERLRNVPHPLCAEAHSRIVTLEKALRPFVKLAEGEPDTLIIRTDSREFKRAVAAMKESSRG